MHSTLLLLAPSCHSARRWLGPFVFTNSVELGGTARTALPQNPYEERPMEDP